MNCYINRGDPANNTNKQRETIHSTGKEDTTMAVRMKNLLVLPFLLLIIISSTFAALLGQGNEDENTRLVKVNIHYKSFMEQKHTFLSYCFLLSCQD